MLYVLEQNLQDKSLNEIDNETLEILELKIMNPMYQKVWALQSLCIRFCQK